MSNLTNNRLNVTMTAAQITAVKGALATIQTNMPFLIGLTQEERNSLPRINVSNKAFTEDAINCVVNNPTIFPPFVSVANMQADLTLFTQLDELKIIIGQLNERITDTQTLAGSEAYVAALMAYKTVGNAADSGMSGMSSLYNQLKQRFVQASESQKKPVAEQKNETGGE